MAKHNRFLRLLLDPDDYAEMLGLSIKNQLFGPQTEGLEGNNALRRSYDRSQTNGLSANALEKFASFFQKELGKSLPDPSTLSKDVIALGKWGFADECIREHAPEIFEVLRVMVMASSSIQGTVENSGAGAYVKQLRSVQGASLENLFHDCADRLEGINSLDFKRIMAPIHIFSATLLVLGYFRETAPDNEETEVLMKRLILGESGLKGPKLAQSRWMDTARTALDYRNKSEFYRSLSNKLDEKYHPEFLDNNRIEWSKVASGTICPPLPKMSQSLKRSVENSSKAEVGDKLHQSLDYGLAYANCISRFYRYLKKQGEPDPDRVFLLALNQALLDPEGQHSLDSS